LLLALYKTADHLSTLKNFFHFFFPPEQWTRIVVIILGIFTGLTILVIYLSNAPSYLSDQPDACVNCHVMYPQFASWSHSSHMNVATCNDCHVPHNSFISKYYFKAKDGLRHAAMFTFRLEPQVIQIKEASQEVVQENCKRCHADLISMVNLADVTYTNSQEGQGHKCWDCHRNTPHGEVNSLASYPFALVPKQNSVVPDWLEKYVGSKENKSSQK
jgi:cytochrome c nitrite reductase small subunit